MVFLLSYALLGTVGTAAIFGGPLTRLKQLLLRLEADLRFGLVRLRWVCTAEVCVGGGMCIRICVRACMYVGTYACAVVCVCSILLL